MLPSIPRLRTRRRDLSQVTVDLPVPDEPATRSTAALSGRYLIQRKLGEGGIAGLRLAEGAR